MKSYITHVSEEDLEIQTVKEHLEATASMAAEFAGIFEGEDVAYVCGLLHDIGKYSEVFYRRRDFLCRNGQRGP